MKVFFRYAVLFLFACILLFSCGCGPQTDKKGAVASANQIASQVGMDVLKGGGNAFDAVVAMAFTLGVTEPNASGIGGGGVMVGYDKEKGYVFYNFREFAPSAATAEAIGGESAMKQGAKAAAVPTEVAGLLKIHQNLGSGNFSRAQIIQPAVDCAVNGFEVTERLNTNISDSYYSFPDNAADIYGNGFTAAKVGSTLKNADYAEVLKKIQTNGADGFYKGEVAEAIIAASDLITQEDLDYAASTYPKTTVPLSGSYNGYEIYTANIPSTGGIVMIETLNMLENYCKENDVSLSGLGHNSAEYIHLVGTATQLAYADKRHYVADTDFADVPVKGLLSKEYAAARFADFKTDDTIRLAPGLDYGGVCGTDPWDYDDNKNGQTYSATSDIRDEGTTSFSAVDKDGNVATITQTLNSYWGSMVMPENTGMFLNNQMADFSFDPESVNLVQPYKQPLSSMAPTLVVKDGKTVMTLGCPGSTTIPAALIQVVLNAVEFGMDMQQAVDALRFQNECVYSYDGLKMVGGANAETHKYITLEQWGAGWTEEITDALKSKNYYVYINGTVTHVYGIQCQYSAEGKLSGVYGGADARREGISLTY